MQIRQPNFTTPSGQVAIPSFSKHGHHVAARCELRRVLVSPDETVATTVRVPT